MWQALWVLVAANQKKIVDGLLLLFQTWSGLLLLILTAIPSGLPKEEGPERKRISDQREEIASSAFALGTAIAMALILDASGMHTPEAIELSMASGMTVISGAAASNRRISDMKEASVFWMRITCCFVFICIYGLKAADLIKHPPH